MDITKLSYLYNITEKEAEKHKEILSLLPNDKYCCFYKPKPIKNIELGDFYSSISALKDYFQGSSSGFLKESINFIKIADNVKNNELIYSNSDDDYFIDYSIINYIKNRPDTYLVILWPSISEFHEDIYNYLNKYSKVIITKNIEINKNQMINLVFDIYNYEFLKINSKNKRIEKAEEYVNNFGFNSKSYISILVFENNNSLNLRKNPSIFKNQLKNYSLQLLNKKNNGSKFLKDDLIFITEEHYQTIELSSIFFNKNSLEYLNLRKIENFFKETNNSTILKFNYVKNWILKHLTFFEQERVFFIGNSIMFLYGNQELEKIHFIFITNKQKTEREDYLSNLFENEFNSKKSISFIKTNYFDINTSKITSFFTNPNNYFYWNGLKILTLSKYIEFTKSQG